MQLQAWDIRSAPFNGPFDLVARLMNGVAAASLPVEGIWTFSGWSKYQSIEVSGSMSTLGLTLYGSNQPDQPLNQYSVTVGGSATAGDTLTLTFGNGNLSGAGHAVNYVVGTGDTLNTIAAAMAALISSDSLLAPLGFVASAAGAVITVSFPSAPTGAPTPQPSQPPPSNATTLVSSLSGGATETLTVAAGTNGVALGAAISALGLTAITTVPRWLTARLTTLTGSGANITADWHGVA